MRADFHCFNLGEGVRKKGLFPPLGERMLNCGLQWGPGSSKLLLAEPLGFVVIYFCSKKTVRIGFHVGASFRLCNPGRMCPHHSVSVLASVPSSCTRAIQREPTEQTASAVPLPNTSVSESCPVPLKKKKIKI
jgi:hypothetical protein